LEVGTVCSFEWTASGPGNVTSVDLLLSRSGPGGSFEVLDTNVPNTGSYLWTVAGTITNNAYLRVVAHGQSPNLDGWDMSDRRFEISSGLAAAGEPPVTQFALAPITPNPMRDRARVEFDLPRAAQVSLTIHDIMGRKLATLASGDFGAGRHSMTWDRSIDRGSAPAGVYFMRYTAGGRTVVRRFAIVR
ncbi:MAG: T9SS type A sorting domain-containing protein, partial [Candidatus Eiseniibacteriota bacterium]